MRRNYEWSTARRDDRASERASEWRVDGSSIGFDIIWIVYDIIIVIGIVIVLYLVCFYMK